MKKVNFVKPVYIIKIKSSIFYVTIFFWKKYLLTSIQNPQYFLINIWGFFF